MAPNQTNPKEIGQFLIKLSTQTTILKKVWFVVFGIQNATHSWAMGNDLISIEIGKTFFDGAIPEYESIKRIGTGNAEPQDAMLLLYLLHYTDRALPKGTDAKPFKRYEVIKDIPNVKEGEIIPWFSEKGGGIQYELPASINDLIK